MDRKIAIIVALIILGAIHSGYQKEQYELEIIGKNEDQSASSLSKPDTTNNGQESTFPESRIDLYQGVEAHLDSINWEGRVFDAQNDNGIIEIGGVNDFKTNKIIFNPDPPTRGLPQLVVTAGNPQPLELSKFVNELIGYQFSPSITRVLSKPRPYETHIWVMRDKDDQKIGEAQMDIWLMEFKLIIDAKPSRDNDLSPALEQKISPITGIKNASLKAEYLNQRYGNLDIVLKLTPAKQAPFIISSDGQRIKGNKSPHFSIAALEVASVRFLGDKENQHRDIGAYLEKGESLALYDKPVFYGNSALGKKDYIDESPDKIVQINREVVGKNLQSVLWSESAFDKDRYAYIHLANFGSWREGAWYQSKSTIADKIEVSFIMHVFVVGDWELKRPVVTGQIQPSMREKEIQPGPFEFLIPSFGLGVVGKYISGAGIFLLVILVLGVFFPPVLSILNTILGAVSALLKRILKK